MLNKDPLDLPNEPETENGVQRIQEPDGVPDFDRPGMEGEWHSARTSSLVTKWLRDYAC